MADSLLSKITDFFRLTLKEPTTPERTGRQIPPSSGGLSGVALINTASDGIAKPSPGTYQTYREMRTDPTIALAREISRAPIQAADWSVDTDDNEMMDFFEHELEEIWSPLIDAFLYAFDYGFAAFEKVYRVDKGRIRYSNIKPLLPDTTEILVDKGTGEFAGLQQKEVILQIPYAVLYTYDGEAGNLYGRSRHENIRSTAWTDWKVTRERMNRYGKKVAGVTPIIEYPEGVGLDANGTEVSNYELAKAVLANLGRGDGVAMPNNLVPYLEDLARLGGAGKEALKAWSISFLEATTAHGKDFIDMLNYDDKLKMRGWLVPERAALEGEHGTKAESATQSQWTYLVGQKLTKDIFRVINRQIIDPLVALNWGQDRVGDVKIRFSSIDPAVVNYMQQLILRIYGAPVNADLALDAIDMAQVIDQTGLPPAPKVTGNAVIVRTNPPGPGEDVAEVEGQQ